MGDVRKQSLLPRNHLIDRIHHLVKAASRLLKLRCAAF
ncbi:Uncharacterised protein [Vibrio cholerae]|nr:Uncharacterised protein [Vibrio cholerae]